MATYTIACTVRGEAQSWSYEDSPTAMQVWDGLRTNRVIPGTADVVTDLVLRSGDRELAKPGEPYSGLAVP